MTTRSLCSVKVAAILASIIVTGDAATAEYPETPEEFTKESYEYGYDYQQQDVDSFKYYGPNELWRKWTPQQRRGRDMWIFWTAGNQKFYRYLQVFAGNLPIPMSIDFFRLLDSRKRDERFRGIGLINEPNFKQADKPNEYGLWLDEWQGDPLNYYPNDYYDNKHDLEKYWGRPTGILGLRMFENPKFTEEMKREWRESAAVAEESSREQGRFIASDKVKEYFAAPGRVEPPYLVGITCAFCHIAFDPLNPPADPDNPRWENLAANIGNQYFDEGGLFFGRGRLGGGDRNPGPNYADDPYDTQGLGPESLLWHYGHTQQRGTSETSRFSYDFINNPNTINAVFNLAFRAPFWEEAPNGVHQPVLHILKDGADSTGPMMALQRVYVNIGAESEYWLDHLFNPITGRKQRPMLVDEMRLQVSPERQAELKHKYRDRIYEEDFGTDWRHTELRIADMLAYLISYGPMYLKDAPGGKDHVDEEQARRGALVFAEHCARCHSNKQPPYYVKPDERKEFYRHLVANDGFRFANTLANDVRFSVVETGINSQRAMATNAIDGDIWANVSSKDYKALPPVGRMRLEVPFVDANNPNGLQQTMQIDYTPEGGGRGYYRTASLVSLWATAPFLHNNSVGREPLRAKMGEWKKYPDVRTYDTDPAAITVEGRLKLFEDACEKLLWPEKRKHYVKRTVSATGLGIGADALEVALIRILKDQAVGSAVAELGRHLQDKGLAPEEADNLLDALRPEIDAALAKYLEKKIALAKQGKAALVEIPLDPVLEKLEQLAGDKLGQLDQAIEIIKKLQALKMVIPEHFPINAIFNQHVDSLPYALQAFVKYKQVPKAAGDAPNAAQAAKLLVQARMRLQQELLELSRCPDVVEDRGHTFGAVLSDEEKRLLIEYLKTL